jgi:hypothetical protein
MLSGANVGMPHAVLDIVELVTGLFKPVSEGSAQGVGGGAFGHACGMDSGGDGLLNTAGVEVMPLDDKGTGVYGAVTGREAVLPFPGGGCSRIFARQRWRHGDRNVKVNLIQAADPLQVGAEALEKPLLVWEEGHAVAVGLGVANGDESVLDVEILDAQAQRFEQSQSAAVEKAGDEVRRAVQFGEDAQAFVMAEGGLDVGAFLRAQGVHIAEGDGENFLIEEQKGGKGLILSGSGNLLAGSEVGEEGFTLRCAHGGGVAEFVEADEAFVPMEVGFLGADGIATQADGVADAIGQFSLRHDGAPALTEISVV